MRRYVAPVLAAGLVFGATACETTETAAPAIDEVATTTLAENPEDVIASPDQEEPAVTSPASTVAESAVEQCVYTVTDGDLLSTIANRINAQDKDIVLAKSEVANPVSFEAIALENAIDAEYIFIGQQLDICVDGFNDINPDQALPTTTTTTTTTTLAPETTAATIVLESQPEEEPIATTTVPEATTTTTPAPEAEPGVGVESIQSHSNSVLSQFGFPELRIDGDYGDFTRQAACLTRAVTGQEVTRVEVSVVDDVQFFTSTDISLPDKVADHAGKILYSPIECQGIIAVESGQIARILPTSTGEQGHETREFDKMAYLLRPSLDNDGWHNSSTFPAAEDNPLNGNMYKPLYFDGGQAIHGANNVPAEPKSKGCLRLKLSDHDWLLDWVGASDLTEESYEGSRFPVRLLTTGEFEFNI